MRIVGLLLGLVAGLAMAGSLPYCREGLIDAPVADVLEHTEIKAGGSFTVFSYEVGDSASSSSETDFAVGGHVDFGLFNRVQLGVTYLNSGGISGSARVLVLRESVKRPGISVGMENITPEEDYEFFRDDEDSLYVYGEAQNWSAYVVVSKDLFYLCSIPASVSLGYGIGRFRQASDAESDGFSNPLSGLFLSVDFRPGQDIDVLAEWDGRDLNLGVEYEFSRYVSAMFAVAELEQMIRSAASDMHDATDVMQNVKFGLGVEVTIGPFFGTTHLDPTERLTPRRGDEEALRQLEEYRRNAQREIEELEDMMD
ncbi:hypothetical protein JW921_00745 [Candidatus Fermentibacterales bacterium]|nr:hypothetical protein [Candidatus Fermentibacterales bacterium]